MIILTPHLLKSTMRSHNETYSSPVLCFKSKWVDTGEQEKYTNNKGEIKYRPKVKLVFKINPEYKGRSEHASME